MRTKYLLPIIAFNISIFGLSPKTIFIDDFLDVKPVSHNQKYANGDQGVKQVIKELLNNSPRFWLKKIWTSFFRKYGMAGKVLHI